MRIGIAFLLFYLMLFNSINAQCPCNTTNELQCAANYLAGKGILDNSSNMNETANIIRQDLAKVSFIGLYGSALATTPADSFPTPFADLQGNWIEYYKYAKALSYLEYKDGISPFDRFFYNFRPGDGISRRYVCKVYVETFNLPVSTATSSTYPDVQSAYTAGDLPLIELQYIETCRQLGLVNAGGNFRPFDLAKRGEAFLMLYRLLCNHLGNTPPTVPNHATNGDYFIPGNYHPANLGNKPSLSDANFDAYSKVSFSISGKNIPMVFAHNYNSHLTELPDELFPVLPLGRGWSHSYNSYIKVIPGYTAQSKTMSDRYVVTWPGGSMYDFTVNGSVGTPVTQGIYDVITYSSNRITIRMKNQMLYTFEKVTTRPNDPFMLKLIQDRNQNTITLVYQTNTNNLTEVIDTGGRKLKFQYITAGSFQFLTRVEDPIGRIITFGYDMAAYDMNTYTDAESKITTYLYGTTNGERHLLKNITLPNGNTIDNEYENRKLKMSQTNNATTGQKIRTDVDWGLKNGVYAGTTSTMTINDGANTRNYLFEQNGLGNLVNGVFPTNTINDVQYNDASNRNLPTKIEVDQVPTTYYYDDKGNIRQIDQPEAVVHKFTYTALNDIDIYTNPRNFNTDFNYDAKGNLKQIITPIGTTTINYNAAGQPSEVINPENIKVTFGYNNFGNQNMVTALEGIISGATYDGASRLKETTNPNQQVTKYDYNPRDFVTQTTDAMNYITQFRYDDNGNLTEIENAKNQITTLTYDQNDFLRTESFGGFTKKYDYDDEGKLKKITKPDNTVLNYSYDPVKGNLTNDDYATYTYDNRNRLETVTRNGKTITYMYDNLNRVKSITYDGETVAYEYDKNSNVTKLTYPDNKVVLYTYDAKDRMETVTDWNGKQTRYEYWKDDRLKITWMPNGTSYDYEYDAAGRVNKLINYRNGGTPWIRYVYTMDKNGNHLVEEKIDEPYPYPAPPTESFTYTHSNNNRLMTGTGDMGANLTWTYDANGNTKTKTGVTYAWDSHDMLTIYDDGTEQIINTYDGLGNRRQAERNLINYRYGLDLLGMSRVLTMGIGGTTTDYYVYGLTLISNVKPNGDTYYYHPDYRGSVIAMTDAAQNIVNSYNYDEYGRITDKMETFYNPFRYVGMHGVMYETDQLTFMRARYYDPTTGRFLSEDPIWSTNLYPYADGNPNIAIDPKGTTVHSVGFSPSFYWGVGGGFDFSVSVDTKKKDISVSAFGTVGVGASASLFTYSLDPEGVTQNRIIADNKISYSMVGGAGYKTELLNKNKFDPKSSLTLEVGEIGIKNTFDAGVEISAKDTYNNAKNIVKNINKTLSDGGRNFVIEASTYFNKGISPFNYNYYK